MKNSLEQRGKERKSRQSRSESFGGDDLQCHRLNPQCDENWNECSLLVDAFFPFVTKKVAALWLPICEILGLVYLISFFVNRTGTLDKYVTGTRSSSFAAERYLYLEVTRRGQTLFVVLVGGLYQRRGGISLHLDDNVSLTKLKDAVGVKEGIPRQAKPGDGDIGGASRLMVLG